MKRRKCRGDHDPSEVPGVSQKPGDREYENDLYKFGGLNGNPAKIEGKLCTICRTGSNSYQGQQANAYECIQPVHLRNKPKLPYDDRDQQRHHRR